MKTVDRNKVRVPCSLLSSVDGNSRKNRSRTRISQGMVGIELQILFRKDVFRSELSELCLHSEASYEKLRKLHRNCEETS